MTAPLYRPFAVSILLGLTALSAAASGLPDAPSLKPQRVYNSQTTDAKNAEILHKALDAAGRYDWNEVAGLQDRATDPAVRDLILWMRASAGVPGMGFDEVRSAMETLPTWPKTGAMRKRAEEIIDLSSLKHGDRILWLTESGPRTGAGKIALARSYKAVGQSAKAEALVRDAWQSNSMERDLERIVLATYGGLLTEADHRARIEFLLWTNQRTAATNLKPLVSSDYRKLVDARIALAGRGRNVDKLVDAVPASLQDNPGLLYDRARWRRTRGNQEGATPLLVSINANDVPEAGRSKLWDERNVAMRDDLKSGKWARAYQLVAPHAMTEGADYADAEWAAGWIALRLNNNPDRSLKHFQDMTASVGTPISLARGEYWTGRAEDALGQTDAAVESYAGAAKYNFTYYGQLAAERLGQKKLSFAASTEPTQEQVAAFNARPMVKALRLLGEAGEERMFREFAYHLDDQLENEADFIQLSQLASQYHVPDIGVRGAKAGLAKGIIATDAAYPLVDYPMLRQPRVERPLMLALSRQESEMNPNAVSHAGARGLMQFMPATAQREARMQGLPFRTSWLTDDPGYNMTLGGQHLDTLLSQFKGSYIMTAAAYNAGPSRPKQWIEDYGDPRTGQVDPVDWVEFIPFSETRNYVQRVLENTQVYRQRLAGTPVDIELSEDLDRGKN
ncbi:MAG: lytic transglycosylase domain-containing protein [Alphaproteobacteria bacterium]|nr:lytic transglycosylase domain-containing protein [Alphaproteobacteria bacterium]MBU2084029.1 lytic transglycosylase domain-containing protein [Alphaproteobacteria bacterium]MBU2144436.1 lytic transglycosylase domain-containing protein [Alphaproteobacteria bacterium]MBU2196306.1 lytic transglycosylase domain-containing protein [Alphaproteobacteria bacterium]